MKSTLLRTSAALAITLLVGCAPDDGSMETGAAGSSPEGAAGTSGGAGTTGSGGTTGSAGTMGSAGTTGSGGNQGVAGTGGSAAGANGGAGASGGQGATAGSGGATGGQGGSGVAGSGGAVGSGGSSAGRGGNGGSNGGRGGAGGSSAGRGGGGGGGSTGTGGGTGGSVAGYNPCPTNGDPCRILPVGDSITFGINQEGSYRIQLFRRATMAMQKITYTGTLQNGPTTVDGVTFPRRYEATSGITIDGISSQITRNNTLNMPCDIITVHIGTNDMYMSNPEGAPTRLGTLLDKLIAGMPNALIVVAKIIPLPSGTANVNRFNNAIPAIIQARADAGKHVMLIDLNTSFPSSGLSSDQVHPNSSGYAWMGDRWYDAIGGLFPK